MHPLINDNVINIRNVTRHFGKTVALEEVSLTVPRGQVFGLVGENGAGKSTLIKHILGLLKAKAGSVRVFGLDPVLDPVGVLGRIGYLSEDRDLPNWMRIEELIRYCQPLYPNWDSAYASQLCETFQLDRNQKIGTLSCGQRARTGLLVAMAHRPELLLLDEPSSGLDPVVRRDILGAVFRTVAQEGRTVLFSSHLLDEVERVADSVAMMNHGRIVLTDTMEHIKELHHIVTLRFNELPYNKPVMPGMLSCEKNGMEWTFLCEGKLEHLRLAAQRVGGQIINEKKPTLDEIFVAGAK